MEGISLVSIIIRHKNSRPMMKLSGYSYLNNFRGQQSIGGTFSGELIYHVLV